ncbi:hypothetical protein ACOME3_007228 [Neoechinorhynchus agilis]
MNALIVECDTEFCSDKDCTNVLVQRGCQVKTKIEAIEHKGKGLFADESIPKSTFLFEYAGIARTTVGGSATGKYILTVTVSSLNYTKFSIDAQNYGNESRYMNHACGNAANTIPVLVWTPRHSIPHVAFFASKDLKKNEEISFDYGWSIDGDVKASTSRCFCNGSQCQRYLPHHRNN